jgi:hypothetical protein
MQLSQYCHEENAICDSLPLGTQPLHRINILKLVGDAVPASPAQRAGAKGSGDMKG